MAEVQKIRLIYMLTALFIALNTALISMEIYYFNMLPAVVLVVLLALFSMDKLILLTVFFTPLSLNLKDTDVGLGLSLPTEPILFGIMVLFLLKLLHEGSADRKLMYHPVTISILFNLFWIFMTCLTSEMPVVSFKFLVSRIWFLTTFYFLAVFMFRKFSAIRYYQWMYILPMLIVIGYTLFQHSMYGFAEKPANWVMTPLFNDHTIYAAVLAMFIPLLIGFCFARHYSLALRLFSVAVLALFLLATVFSYTRAAWVSLAGALVVYLVMLMRVKFKYILGLLALAAVAVSIYSTEIIMSLERNRQDSSQDFAEHIQSVSNISSDASNLERLNRWSCALRMFYERPFFGWGPGTYSFQYAPFQLKREETIISTHAGTGGNAHSEYLGPLSESGVIGALSFLVIALVVTGTGFRLYYKLKDRESKQLVSGAILGLMTYFIHGVMNNFLDTDKASAPFWGFVALIVAVDLYHRERKEESLPEKA